MFNRRKIGIWLMKVGSRLYFRNDFDRERLKKAINNDTLTGGYCGTAGYALSDVKPMCDFDTQSVINVLRHGHLTNVCNYAGVSRKVNPFLEEWK